MQLLQVKVLDVETEIQRVLLSKDFSLMTPDSAQNDEPPSPAHLHSHKTDEQQSLV